MQAGRPIGRCGGIGFMLRLLVIRPSQAVEQAGDLAEVAPTIVATRHADGGLGEVVSENVLRIHAIHPHCALGVDTGLDTEARAVPNRPGIERVAIDEQVAHRRIGA